MMHEVIEGECLAIMAALDSQSIDMVLCDLPYGTTQNKWDSVIPFAPMWDSYRRITKPASPAVLMCAQPFTSLLISSNLREFRYCWVWDKVNAIRNHLNAKKQPLRSTEDIAVFFRQPGLYTPQMREGSYTTRKTKANQSESFGAVNRTDVGRKIERLYPLNLISIKGHFPNSAFHPTQKPVALMEYLIRTYTNEGDTVLDNTCGSGTTGVACVNTGRNFIGIEQDPGYVQIARKRIAEARRVWG